MTTPTFSPVLLSMIRRVMPTMLAHQICGVQPMTEPTASIHSLRATYLPRESITQMTDEVFRLKGELLSVYEWLETTKFTGNYYLDDEEELATKILSFEEISDHILFKLTWYNNV
jgi:hypothetical protein